jgi:hypothetical protein
MTHNQPNNNNIKGIQMGYSCRKDANNTLDRLTQYYREHGEKSSNTFHAIGKKYFWEIGKENSDGAITGKVNECTADDTQAFYIGGFRISPDGEVERFPRLPKEVKNYLNALLKE